MKRAAWLLLGLVIGLGAAYVWSRRASDAAIRAPDPLAAAPQPAHEKPRTDERDGGPRIPALSGDAAAAASAATDSYSAPRVVVDRFHGYADEAWAAEPRVDVWARRREGEMTAYARDDIAFIDPAATVEIECHRAICRVRIYSSDPFLSDQMTAFPFACMGERAMAGGGEDDRGRYSEAFVIFDPASVDHGGFSAQRTANCDHRRAAWRDEGSDAARPR